MGGKNYILYNDGKGYNVFLLTYLCIFVKDSCCHVVSVWALVTREKQESVGIWLICFEIFQNNISSLLSIKSAWKTK